MNQDKHTNKLIYKALAVLCGCVLLGCLIWAAAYYIGLKRADSQLEELKTVYIQESVRTPETVDMSGVINGGQDQEEVFRMEAVGQETSDAAESLPDSIEGYPVPEKEIDFQALQEEQNQDIYAWITIPNTKIDYPVLQHPEELDYYLEYNIDGSKGYPGCIYTQLINSKDWTDKHTVLYGHNMKNGSMFANLHYYEDPEFFEENPYVYIYTQKGVLVYRIFAAYEFGSAHLLLSFDTSTPEKYQEYLDNIFTIDGMNNNFDTEVELTADSRIITLSTCISGKADKRYLVQAVLVAAQEIEK